MIKGAIFGLDGTLLEFTRIWDEVLEEGFQATADWYYTTKHLQLDREGLVKALRQAWPKALQVNESTQQQSLMHDVLRRTLKTIKASDRAEPLIAQALRAFYEPQELAYQPIDGAINLLKMLKAQGLKVGIFANSLDDALIQRLVNTHGLRPWVSPVFSSAGLGRRKPHPVGFTLIAERWQLAPEEIVVIGDCPGSDILGGKNAGMRTILTSLTATGHKPSPAIQADRVVHLLAQVPPAIEILQQAYR